MHVFIFQFPFPLLPDAGRYDCRLGRESVSSYQVTVDMQRCSASKKSFPGSTSVLLSPGLESRRRTAWSSFLLWSRSSLLKGLYASNLRPWTVLCDNLNDLWSTHHQSQEFRISDISWDNGLIRHDFFIFNFSASNGLGDLSVGLLLLHNFYSPVLAAGTSTVCCCHSVMTSLLEKISSYILIGPCQTYPCWQGWCSQLPKTVPIVSWSSDLRIIV